ncbi:VOC family protein [Mycolicibacterium sp. 120266]|uniref:VOC family protein n=1 Tax=Mycolicibacterium sp. 120266 TaxID=3090601 RepID=UPI00299D6539|nr:VOC family protein [Mycolicibacterium sp. 120266]MDX1873039.1 VOC family protein [Mycolicibacterium sp. 120266]
MRINVTSVLVDDQDKALRFYTDVLGFRPKHDVPVGEYRWASTLVADGIPFTSFAVDDIQAEYERLVGRGVRFTQQPVSMGTVTTAVFDDTCGNLIQIAQHHG